MFITSCAMFPAFDIFFLGIGWGKPESSVLIKYLMTQQK
jgi:hypothetical protein